MRSEKYVQTICKGEMKTNENLTESFFLMFRFYCGQYRQYKYGV